MKIVAFVPIKLNSERVPLKNIRPFANGEPLIAHILSTLKEVEGIDEIYVYCSSDEIVKYLPEGVKFYKRDEYYDLSTTPFNEVLISFAEKVSADAYILTHATAPFLSRKSFEKAIEAMKSGKFDSALTVTGLNEFIWKDGKPWNYDVNNIPRTQDLEKLYVETCGLFAYTRDLILKKKRRIGDNPCLIEVSKIEATDINIEEDFIIAEAIAKSIEKQSSRGEENGIEE